MKASERFIQLQQMLKDEPNDLFLNYSIAMEYLSAGDIQKAIKAFQRTLQLKPDYIPAFYQLGKAYESISEMEKALSYYRQGLDLARLQKNNKSVNEFGEAIFMLED
jgi:tetratricopeptide (TPR) repeat protein